LTGGNFLVDGHEAAFSTCAMVGENQQLWTEAEFLDLAEQYLGIRDYQVMNNTENYGIHHIDCWPKPLDEETLLVKLPPVTHEEYDRIQTNLEMLALARTRYGRPYRVIRIDTPPYNGYDVAAYTNSLILNKKVLVPQFNIPGDEDAIAAFEAAMPGYEVIGFPWGGWYHYDALHCRTRAIFDRHMLHVTHRRLAAWVPNTPQHEVTAFIDDRSEAGPVADALKVYWREAGAGAWGWEQLTTTAEPDVYTGAIPGQSPGTTVEYYIAAADQSGREETLPRTAPDGFYAFTVGCEPITLTLQKTRLTWTGLAGATGYDVVRGDLDSLHETGGDFTAAVDECAANDYPTLALSYTETPEPQGGFWFLVRGRAGTGNTSYSSSTDCDRTTRDALIDVALASCP
jgi:hypothetical protein